MYRKTIDESHDYSRTFLKESADLNENKKSHIAEKIPKWNHLIFPLPLQQA